METNPLRVTHQEATAVLQDKLLSLGFAPARAALCARLFADASRDGVPSHGFNRFPGFVAAVRAGVVDPQAEPALTASLGALEQWDGRRGPGNLNAYAAMDRAMTLAREHGLGAVALANTNHWMRGGAYGWQAAEAGFIGVCWTNTLPNMPPWGTAERRVGNNPLVIAVPRAAGHVVLDMALSQFSFGVLAGYARRGEPLPVPGGFDAAGQPTHDPQAIFASGRPLPIGYWKGSGLALALDLLAALLSGGQATHQIGANPAGETAVSQVFLALPPGAQPPEAREALVNGIVAHFQGNPGAEHARYPGEGALAHRAESDAHGLPVEPETWERILAL
jgi:3-dehydro-L-gulonate 2-dehydrogenase